MIPFPFRGIYEDDDRPQDPHWRKVQLEEEVLADALRATTPLEAAFWLKKLPPA